MCGLQERRSVTALTDRSTGIAGDQPRSVGRTRRVLVAVVVTIAVVAADQLTKWWAVTRLADGRIHLVGTLDLELARNSGASFSLFQGKGFILAPVAVVLVGALAVMVWRAPTAGRAALLGLILGGALGNLSDRLFRDDHGSVVDFVAVHFWPTFNLADAAVVVGCVLLVASLVRGPRHP
ncbi:MAG TPA: signal peptidase II [Acidimicrobiales bacterium]|nr:signal peptidase II [Acidimicrobiales bacterium]